MQLTTAVKRTARAHFDGSPDLFNACWRELCRTIQHGTDLDTQDDVDQWLEQLAAERVNNPRSRFYIYG